MDQLKQLIASAFQGVPMPSRGSVVDVGSRSDHAADAQQHLAGKSWTAVSAEVIIENWLSLIVLDSSAFLYYCPAFLLAAIDHVNNKNVNFIEETIMQLLPPSSIDRANVPPPEDLPLPDELRAELAELHLGPATPEEMAADLSRFLERASLFNRSQRLAVCSFLEFMQSHGFEGMCGLEGGIQYWRDSVAGKGSEVVSE